MTYAEMREQDPRTDVEIITDNPLVFVYGRPDNSRGLWIVQHSADYRVVGWSSGGSTRWVRKPKELRVIESMIDLGTIVARSAADAAPVLVAARVEWQLEGIK